jgi:hypothetical protein
MHPDLAGKITGMLLEIDNSELVHMLEHQESLKGKVSLREMRALVVRRQRPVFKSPVGANFARRRQLRA